MLIFRHERDRGDFEPEWGSELHKQLIAEEQAAVLMPVSVARFC